MTNFKSMTLAAFLALASAPLTLTLAPTAVLAQNGGNGGGGGGGGGAGAGGNSSDGIFELLNYDAQRKQARAAAGGPNDPTFPPRVQTYVVDQCHDGRATRSRCNRTRY